MSNFKEDLKDIKAFIFDIDGVLSNQTVILSDDGNPQRTINLRDGYAIQLAIKKGYKVAVISGGNSTAFESRLNLLGVDDVFLNSYYKKDVYTEYLKNKNLKLNEVLYMGDDIPDIEVMGMVGVAACPRDADSEIKQISDYISDKDGGNGCVRDVIEQVMRLHGKWLNNDAFIW